MIFMGSIARWFRERRRNIFRYHDGTGWVRADPVVLGNRLDAELKDYEDVLELLQKDPKSAPVGTLRDQLQAARVEAAKKLAACARKVFDLAPLGRSDGGVTDPEAIAVLVNYIVFMRGLAAAAELFHNSPVTA